MKPQDKYGAPFNSPTISVLEQVQEILHTTDILNDQASL